MNCGIIIRVSGVRVPPPLPFLFSIKTLAKPWSQQCVGCCCNEDNIDKQDTLSLEIWRQEWRRSEQRQQEFIDIAHSFFWANWNAPDGLRVRGHLWLTFVLFAHLNLGPLRSRLSICRWFDCLEKHTNQVGFPMQRGPIFSLQKMTLGSLMMEFGFQLLNTSNYGFGGGSRILVDPIETSSMLRPPRQTKSLDQGSLSRIRERSS